MGVITRVETRYKYGGKNFTDERYYSFVGTAGSLYENESDILSDSFLVMPLTRGAKILLGADPRFCEGV